MKVSTAFQAFGLEAPGVERAWMYRNWTRKVRWIRRQRNLPILQ